MYDMLGIYPAQPAFKILLDKVICWSFNIEAGIHPLD